MACPRIHNTFCCPGYFPGLHFCHPCIYPLLNVFCVPHSTACFCQASWGQRKPGKAIAPRTSQETIGPATPHLWGLPPDGLDLWLRHSCGKQHGLRYQNGWAGCLTLFSHLASDLGRMGRVLTLEPPSRSLCMGRSHYHSHEHLCVGFLVLITTLWG